MNKGKPTSKMNPPAGMDGMTNPMLLSPIISCVYQYLGLEDIKNCRLAAREWSLNSKLVLRDRSKIVLTNRGTNYRNCFTISKFLKDFSSTANIPFNAFKFTSRSGVPNFFSVWKVKELIMFFEKQQENIKELELDYLHLEDNKSMMIKKYNITPWISRSLMIKPNTKYNTKLSLHGCLDGNQSAATLSVSLSTLICIKDISLTESEINADNTERLKMVPLKLKLDRVKFCSGEIELNEICINDFVDLSTCKSLHLRSGGLSTKMTLDLSENEKPVSLDNLTLIDLTVANWSSSSWHVNELKMERVPFLDISGMQIVKLTSTSDIDLFALPQSIEILSLTQRFNEIICSHPISFPNLKCLHLNIYDSAACSILSHFKNCPKLVDIDLNGYLAEGKMAIKFNWIPKGIKRLKFSSGMGISWESVGKRRLMLDQIVFPSFSNDDVKNICIDNVQVKEIVLILNVYGGRCASHKGFIDLLEYFNSKSKGKPQRIYAGPFSWSTLNWKRIQNVVDQDADYYVFENKRGRAIQKKVFDDLIAFDT